jgi:phosphatidylserine/phosphatidylglycerophosphate/cardiolipin synthase-like enzyme
MRYQKSAGGISVEAIAGTYVVTLLMNATDNAREGLLGFAVYRIDKSEKEEYWLKGMRVFEETAPPGLPAGTLVSTQEFPVQDFAWGDFTAKPDHRYVYRVVPVRGKPKGLKYGTPVELEVKTEKEEGSTHSVYFNRGVIGSQAYSREFHSTPPDKLKGDEQERAYAWLSRGLERAMLAFISKANSSRYGLRAAVYEFSYEPAIAAFAAAGKKCKDVKIIYDARRPSGSGKSARQARARVDAVEKMLAIYDLEEGAIPRTKNPSFIAHNKFIVLLDNDKPVAVWTGSTNFTESGIFGQSNVGHAVYDEDIAKTYCDYWDRLSKDPESADIKAANEEASPDIKTRVPVVGTTPIFSPRSDLTMLNWYAASMKGTSQVLAFTAAFGVNKVFLQVLKVPKSLLRYIFLEKWGVNAKGASAAQKALGADRFNQVAVGNFLGEDVLEEYLKERWKIELRNNLGKNVRYTHTKYMLVDPLGDDPIIVSGSANFSDASTKNNDENMLIIRGDKRVADIYFGEFMRLWQHYRFRSIVHDLTEKGVKMKPNYLTPDSSWTDDYYKKGTVKYAKRTLLSA